MRVQVGSLLCRPITQGLMSGRRAGQYVRVSLWEREFVPDPDGEPLDLLELHGKEYYDPTWRRTG